MAAGAELQRTQVAPEADAFTFSTIASHAGVTTDKVDLTPVTPVDVLARLRVVTNAMEEAEVSTGSRYLFITPTLKGVLDDFSLANPTRSNAVLSRSAKVVVVLQVRFWTGATLRPGTDGKFGYVGEGAPISNPLSGRFDTYTNTRGAIMQASYLRRGTTMVLPQAKRLARIRLSWTEGFMARNDRTCVLFLVSCSHGAAPVLGHAAPFN